MVPRAAPAPHSPEELRTPLTDQLDSHHRTLAVVFGLTALAMLVTPLLDVPFRIALFVVALGAFAYVVIRGAEQVTQTTSRAFTVALNALTNEVNELETQNAALAVVDRTTNVATLDYLFLRLRDEIERSRRYKRAVTLVIVDVVEFRTVNQRFGREMANIVLQHLALNLRNAVRSTDVVARYGGDQFAVMLPETDAEEARIVIARIIERAQQRIVLAADLHVLLRVRLGAASYPAATTPEALVRAVEQSLALAKAE